MWGWGYNLRPLPTVNYAETSDEEDFNSPLQSPRRPVHTRQGSPAEELRVHPTLSDNVDDVLEGVSTRLYTAVSSDRLVGESDEELEEEEIFSGSRQTGQHLS